MCMICGFTKCPSGCPNAPDPEPVGHCEWCGDPIYPGDECYQLDGGPIYHAECLKENAFDILTENIDTEYFTAVSDPGWYED